MPPKKRLKLSELEKLDESGWEDLFEGITEEQAENSDIGGDDDADDVIPAAPRPSRAPSVPVVPVEDHEASKSSVGTSSDESDSSSSSSSDVEEENNMGRSRGRGFGRRNRRGQGRGRVRTRGGARPVSRVPDQPFNFTRTYRQPPEYKAYKFDEYQGINAEIDISQPLKIFQLFFTVEVLAHIIEESNRYAHQLGVALNLHQDELEAFLGILIIMGFHQLPSLRNYWSTNPNFKVERIVQIMPLKRFLRILRFLHLNDNRTMKRRDDPEFDRLHKVRPLLMSLATSFRTVFSPSRFLSIDESMIPFKGRSTMKQYMPNKPTKRGFKVWVICCAVTGYMISMEVYEGKKEDRTEYGLGERVVMDLSNMFIGLGYCLFFDRFFTSIILMKELLKRNLFACGTILAKRKHFPKHRLKEDKALETGDFDSVMDGSVSVTKWMDRGTKSVIMSSNMHSPAEMETVQRTNKKGEKEAIVCPKIISDYNKYMGGVDRFDQLMSSYAVAWKSRRWWMKIFYYLLDAAIVNSFIIYKDTVKKSSSTRKPMTQLEFRSQLADTLIKDFSSRKKMGPRHQPQSSVSVDFSEHYFEKSTLRRCAYCCTSENYCRSKYCCSVCKVALCILCFYPFHKNGCKKINK